MNGINVRSAIHTVPMFRYAIFIIIGIVTGDLLTAVDERGWLLMMTGAVAGAMACNKKHPQISSILILIGVTGVGGFRICHDNANMVTIEEELQGVECSMAVLSEPIARGKVTQFDGLVHSCSKRPELVGTKMRVSVLRDTITKKYKRIHIGDGMNVAADLSPLKDWHRQNAHFDYIRWLKTRGFCGRAFIPIGKWEREDVGWSDIGIAETIKSGALRFRQRILERMEGSGMEYDAYAVATAMALGNKSSLSPELREEYSISGASHVLALSGVHLTIIYIMLSLVLGKKRKGAKVGVLLMVWIYVLLTGMPVSVIRAAWMLTIWEILRMISYEQKALNVLGFTACVMVMCNPQCVWDVGFEMSFAAMLGIIALMEPFRDIMPEKLKAKSKEDEEGNPQPRHKRWTLWALRSCWFTIALSISAQLGTLPLTAYYFGRVSVYFILTNLVAVPAVTLTMWIAMVMVAVVSIDIMAGVSSGMVTIVLGKLLTWVAGSMNWLMACIAKLPGASIEGVNIDVIGVVAMYVIVIAIAVYANRRRGK